jgi:hypothetical protein
VSRAGFACGGVQDCSSLHTPAGARVGCSSSSDKLPRTGLRSATDLHVMRLCRCRCFCCADRPASSLPVRATAGGYSRFSPPPWGSGARCSCVTVSTRSATYCQQFSHIDQNTSHPTVSLCQPVQDRLHGFMLCANTAIRHGSLQAVRLFVTTHGTVAHVQR